MVPAIAGSNLFSKQTATLEISLTNPEGVAVLARGTGAAPTTASTFAHGAIYIRTDSGTGTPALYQNIGSTAVPSWSLLDVAGAISPLTDAHIFVGNAGNVATDVAVTGDVTISNTGVTAISALAVVNADISATAAIDFSKLATLTSGNILVGGAGNLPTQVTMSGDATISNTGVITVANSAITNAKTLDSAGVGGLFVQKSAVAVYNFATDGGTVGAIPLTGSPTIPDNAVVWCDSYEVVTTCTTDAADAGTITLGFPTDGDLFTAIQVADVSNPWDQGVFVPPLGALVAQTPKKLTGPRTLQVTVGAQNVTAGLIIFHLSYWVSV